MKTSNMKTSHITKSIILTLIFVLSTNICKAQLDFLQYRFGDTKEELLENIKRDVESNISVYDNSKSNEITFTLEHRISSTNSVQVKATCHFINGIFYKVENIMRTDGRTKRNSKGQRIENGYQMLYRINQEMLEKEWYNEDKSREIRCCDKGFYASSWSKPGRYVNIYCIPEDGKAGRQEFGLTIEVK